MLDALWLIRDRPLGVLSGAIGYMAFDIVALGASFKAFGYFPAVGVLVVAYLIGQLGGLLPLPGGIGGIELGLVGSFAVFNVPVSASAAAVLAYRVLQLWIPAILGTLAFVQLRDLLRGKQQDVAAMCSRWPSRSRSSSPLRASAGQGLICGIRTATVASTLASGSPSDSTRQLACTTAGPRGRRWATPPPTPRR